MSRYILVPIHNGKSKEISIPANLYTPSSGTDPLINACTRLFLIENGNIHHNGEDLGIPFRQFIKDTKKRKFLTKYARVYSILKSIGLEL